VTIAGQPTTLWDDPGSGEFLVAWTLEGRNVALVANSADLTQGELVRIAESVTIP